ncbi:nucleic acid-binding, OB-fold protein, partial [Tanacetum coccineum]
MDLANVGDTSQQDRGKMILMEPNITYILELSTTNYDKTIEAIVYRKWTSKTTKTRTPTKFCCILIDKEGYPIQANMSLRDAEYFDQLLQLRKAYRFSGFSCEPTDKWERTLPTKTSLIFGRFLQVEEIPATEFPEHYFNFAAYNELQDRLTARNPILTDYIGHIRAIGRIEKKGDAMSSRKTLRVIDIENLSGNVIGCTLWNEMATNFDEREYNSMEKPVIIAVSSCYINRYHGLQLSGTSATHYYLDPNIPETRQIKALCPQLPNTGPMLEIVHQRYEDMEREKMRNRFPLAILHDVDPQNYQRVRFTTEAVIYSISTQRRWYYQKCSQCGQKLKEERPVPKCKDHGPQIAQTYSGGTTGRQNPYILPPNLQQLQGTTHIFQFHFDSMTSSRRPNFVLDRVFPKTQLTLPPPEPTETVETHITPETQQTYDNKEPEQPDKPEEITQTQSPISQMTTSPPIAETDTDTPTYKHISDTKNTDTNAPKLSIKKPLFQDEPQTSNPQTPKKQKTKSVDKEKDEDVIGGEDDCGIDYSSDKGAKCWLYSLGRAPSNGSVYVCNLPPGTDEDMLAEFFGTIGLLKKDKRIGRPKIWIYRDKVTNKPKGDVTVTFEDPYAAQAAVEWFNNKEFHGTMIEVLMAEGRGDASGNAPPKAWQQDGDWMCPNTSCTNVNFAFRGVCNRCGSARPAGASGGGGGRGRGRGGPDSGGGRGAAGGPTGLFGPNGWSCP